MECINCKNEYYDKDRGEFCTASCEVGFLRRENLKLVNQLAIKEKLLLEELENTYNLGRDIEALEDIGMEKSLELKPFQNPKNWTVHTIQGKKVYGFNRPELLQDFTSLYKG